MRKRNKFVQALKGRNQMVYIGSDYALSGLVFGKSLQHWAMPNAGVIDPLQGYSGVNLTTTLKIHPLFIPLYDFRFVQNLFFATWVI